MRRKGWATRPGRRNTRRCPESRRAFNLRGVAPNPATNAQGPRFASRIEGRGAIVRAAPFDRRADGRRSSHSSRLDAGQKKDEVLADSNDGKCVIPRQPLIWNRRMCWSTRCAGGSRHGRVFASTCNTCPNRSARHRSRRTRTTCRRDMTGVTSSKFKVPPWPVQTETTKTPRLKPLNPGNWQLETLP